MFDRYEKRAIAFIEKRPALRTTLMLTALLGIAKGAFDVVIPIAGTAMAPIMKFLPLSPERVQAEQFSCALFRIPAAVAWVEVVALTPETEAKLDVSLIKLIRSVQQDAFTCYELLGFTNRLTYTYATASSDRNAVFSELAQKLPASYAALRGHLIANNLPTARLLALGTELKRLEADLRFCTLSKCNEDVTDEIRQQIANVEHAHEQASKEFPYRFPPLKLNEKSAPPLLSSVSCWKQAIWKVLSLPTPRIIETNMPPQTSKEPSPVIILRDC